MPSVLREARDPAERMQAEESLRQSSGRGAASEPRSKVGIGRRHNSYSDQTMSQNQPSKMAGTGQYFQQIGAGCQLVSKVRQMSRVGASFGRPESYPSFQATSGCQMFTGKCQPVSFSKLGNGHCLDIPYRSNTDHKKKSSGARIQIGPISASTNVRTDSGSGGKADHG